MAKKKLADGAPSFEDSLEKLESIVRQLEDGQLGLSESLARYEEGIGHLKHCYQALTSAEQKIELLTSVDEDGVTTTEPFDSDDEQPEPNKKKRAARSTSRRAQSSEATSLDAETQEDGADVDTQRGLF